MTYSLKINCRGLDIEPEHYRACVIAIAREPSFSFPARIHAEHVTKHQAQHRAIQVPSIRP